MKRKIKILLKILFLFLIVVVVLAALTPLVTPKWITNDDNMMTYITKGFYAEKEDSLDAVFIGNSDVYRGISPMKIWEDYGIPTYSFAAPGQRMWTTYYYFEECFRTQNPQVVFLNMDSVFTEVDASLGNYKKSMDNTPFSINKLKAIWNKDLDIDTIEKIGLTFPIFSYHSRILDLTSEDYELSYKSDWNFSYKGMDLITTAIPYKNGFDYMKDEEIAGENAQKYEFDKKAIKYVDKIVSLCKDKGIKLVLMELPSADSWSMNRHDTCEQYASENNLEFIDFNLLGNDIEFDWTTDTSDGGDHLNVSGAEKVSNYLGKYLSNEPGIESKANDSSYSKWNEDLKIYRTKRIG